MVAKVQQRIGSQLAADRVTFSIRALSILTLYMFYNAHEMHAIVVAGRKAVGCVVVNGNGVGDTGSLAYANWNVLAK